jgi:hypothetical protein
MGWWEIVFPIVVLMAGFAALMWTLTALGWLKPRPGFLGSIVADKDSTRPLHIVRMVCVSLGALALGVIFLLVVFGVVH